MATYMIETYLARTHAGELDDATSRLRAAASNAPQGEPRRHIRSFFVPEDEMAFHVVEAPSLEAARALSRRAGITAERIVEAEGSS